MVRRLKSDLREISGGLPIRRVVRIALKDLPADAPELQQAQLLDEYWEAQEQRLEGLPPKQRAAQGLILINLQKRLFSSIEAFFLTLSAHRRTLEKSTDQTSATAAQASTR